MNVLVFGSGKSAFKCWRILYYPNINLSITDLSPLTQGLISSFDSSTVWGGRGLELSKHLDSSVQSLPISQLNYWLGGDSNGKKGTVVVAQSRWDNSWKSVEKSSRISLRSGRLLRDAFVSLIIWQNYCVSEPLFSSSPPTPSPPETEPALSAGVEVLAWCASNPHCFPIHSWWERVESGNASCFFGKTIPWKMSFQSC